jgi:hypothetical protein
VRIYSEPKVIVLLVRFCFLTFVYFPISVDRARLVVGPCFATATWVTDSFVGWIDDDSGVRIDATSPGIINLLEEPGPRTVWASSVLIDLEHVLVETYLVIVIHPPGGEPLQVGDRAPKQQRELAPSQIRRND